MDTIEYYKSIGLELDILQKRVRQFINNAHWLTDGEWKESVLRSILKRHAPDSVKIGRGFVLTEDAVSTQIDILIYDSSCPVLFKDGDLVFVTPDAVKGIIEVKSKINDCGMLTDTINKLSNNLEFINRNNPRYLPNNCFVGIFSYNLNINILNDTLSILKENSNGLKERIVNHICLGGKYLFKYWDKDPQNHERRDIWAYYMFEDNLARAYFINNILSYISDSVLMNENSWFPNQSKERYRVNTINLV